MKVSYEEALRAAEAALIAHGASSGQAASVAGSVVSAEAEGARPVGLSHLVGYCAALAEGRVDGAAEPTVEEASETLTRVDARQGFPHFGVDRALPRLVASARSQGVGLLALRNGYTSGQIGYFVRRLAEEHGLAALAAANAGPAVMPVSGGTKPMFCTNPLAFAVPTQGDAENGAIVIDQSSSSAALVAIRQAAAEGRQIPEGWALDAGGASTTDPAKALDGGVLLPFGGARGANIALMVELLAAGLTGATWSYRAAPFNRGPACPSVGLFILAIDPDRSGEGAFAAHLAPFLETIRADSGAYLPGLAKGASGRAARSEGIEVDDATWARLMELSARPA